MAHNRQADDENIIAKCREYGFYCTYDLEPDPALFHQGDVQDAIQGVLKSRREQAGRLEEMLRRAGSVAEPLDRLIGCAEELANDGTIEDGIKETLRQHKDQLAEKKNSLEKNTAVLEEVKAIMDRTNIRVPVVGIINSGKSTFLRSALGDIDQEKKKNLFPSAGALKSCTGTRTILIYDDGKKGVTVTARFKDEEEFRFDCRQAVVRMKEILGGNAGAYPELCRLEESLEEKTVNPVQLLRKYQDSGELRKVAAIPFSEDIWESVHNFCSMVHFSRNQDYSEKDMSRGLAWEGMGFRADELVQSWTEGTPYSMEISPENDFGLVKRFVCKYNPDAKEADERYTAYCGVKQIEIRGNLCEKIAGLELVDSVGANDDAISIEDQMTALLKESDAVILIKRPQSQMPNGWTVKNYIDLFEEQNKAPDQFLNLVLNCYRANEHTPSELWYDLDTVKQYKEKCRSVYVSDIGDWEEVQAKVLADVLFRLAGSIEKTHKDCLERAQKASGAIRTMLPAIGRLAKSLGRVSKAGNDASEKMDEINRILYHIYDEIEKLVIRTKEERNNSIREEAVLITEELQVKDEYEVAYHYVSSGGPRYIYNRYTMFLCMYSHMLEDVRRQYGRLESEINSYVEEKRGELLDILWNKGRFCSVIEDMESPSAQDICDWLKENNQEALSDVFYHVFLKDIRAEDLIDSSIGKLIEQFGPQNLTMEELLGRELSDPELEHDEERKLEVIRNQLSGKLEEMRLLLGGCLGRNAMSGVSGDENGKDGASGGSGRIVSETVSDGRNTKSRFYESEDDGDESSDSADLKKDWRNSWYAADQKESSAEKSDSGKDRSEEGGPESTGEENSREKLYQSKEFDLDSKVREDLVCDGILKKFWDRLRGIDVSQGTGQPWNQLYNLYYRYYDQLATEDERAAKEHARNLEAELVSLSDQLSKVCQ